MDANRIGKKQGNLRFFVQLVFLSLVVMTTRDSAWAADKSKTMAEGKKMNKAQSGEQGKEQKGEFCSFPKDDSELRKLLSPEQYEITMKNGTEMPFQNQYWDNKHPGIYVDVISGDALFSSKDKFDSGTGWPSFTKPIADQRVKEKKDVSHGMTRVEVRSQRADSHLGHVFDDGPGPNGLRYCINSASMRFVPLEKMQEQGYEKFIVQFSAEDWNYIKKNGEYKNKK